VERVLHLPKISRVYGLSNQDIGDLISLLTSRATVVSGDMAVPRTARDPDDDHILACAKAGQADYIVTGDQDLLSLERFEGIPIVSPAAFAAILRTSS
jgi:putative PIN family toxin of toxin-antitoxin system